MQMPLTKKQAFLCSSLERFSLLCVIHSVCIPPACQLFYSSCKCICLCDYELRMLYSKTDLHFTSLHTFPRSNLICPQAVLNSSHYFT